MKNQNIIICVACMLILLILGCTNLLFQNPMPANEQTITTIPDFIEGKYLIEGTDDTLFGSLYYDVEQLSDQHCRIYKYNEMSIDSVESYAKRENEDIISVKWADTALVLTSKDSVEIISNLELIGDKLRTLRELKYDIDLANSLFLSGDSTSKKCLLKAGNDRYYLNTLEDTLWEVIVIIPDEEDNLQLVYTNVTKDDYEKNMDYYNGISPIEKIDDNKYMANPTDEAFQTLMRESALTSTEHWIKIKKEKEKLYKSYVFYLVLFGLIFLIVLLAFIFRNLRKPRSA